MGIGRAACVYSRSLAIDDDAFSTMHAGSATECMAPHCRWPPLSADPPQRRPTANSRRIEEVAVSMSRHRLTPRLMSAIARFIHLERGLTADNHHRSALRITVLWRYIDHCVGCGESKADGGGGLSREFQYVSLYL